MLIPETIASGHSYYHNINITQGARHGGRILCYFPCVKDELLPSVAVILFLVEYSGSDIIKNYKPLFGYI